MLFLFSLQMELRHCSRLAVSIVRLTRQVKFLSILYYKLQFYNFNQPKICNSVRNFSSSSRLFPVNSSQVVFKRSLSWQFWKSSSTTTPATVDSWPANAIYPTPESTTVIPPVLPTPPSSIPPIPDVPKIEADEFGYIPEPPTIPSDVPVEFYLNAAGEPALSTLGLGHWYLPTGWVQQGLDFLHANLDLPWWATIMLGTLILRTATIPIAIYNQRSAGQMQIHMPKLQELQGKLQEARIRNDQLASKKK